MLWFSAQESQFVINQTERLQVHNICVSDVIYHLLKPYGACLHTNKIMEHTNGRNILVFNYTFAWGLPHIFFIILYIGHTSSSEIKTTCQRNVIDNINSKSSVEPRSADTSTKGRRQVVWLTYPHLYHVSLLPMLVKTAGQRSVPSDCYIHEWQEMLRKQSGDCADGEFCLPVISCLSYITYTVLLSLFLPWF